MGYQKVIQTDNALRKGLNVFKGKVVSAPVADSLQLEYTPLEMYNELSMQHMSN